MISQEADLSKNNEQTPSENASQANTRPEPNKPASSNPDLTAPPTITTPSLGATEQDQDEVLDIAEGKVVPEDIDVTQDDSPRPFSPEAQQAGVGDTYPRGADASEGQDSAASGDDADDHSNETRQGT
jgi:hypothetical protein